MKTLEINPIEIKQFLDTLSPETKVYLGADSEKIKIGGKWYADYMLVVVVHMNGNKGCRIFGEIQREIVYDRDQAKPTMRLMTEAYKVAELWGRVKDVLEDFEVEIHLDLNPNKKYVSNHVTQQAIGYIKGVTNMVPKIKPQAFSASYAADQLKNVLAHKPKTAPVDVAA